LQKNIFSEKYLAVSKKDYTFAAEIKNRDVAQLVAYTYGVRVVAGSSPVIPTFLFKEITSAEARPL
jgi:hypothetical protein